MNLFDFLQAFIQRTGQYTLQDWLLTFACIILAYYAIALSRR